MSIQQRSFLRDHRLLQFDVFRVGNFEDRNVEVGVVPGREETRGGYLGLPMTQLGQKVFNPSLVIFRVCSANAKLHLSGALIN